MKIGFVGFGWQMQSEYVPLLERTSAELFFVCDPSRDALAHASALGPSRTAASVAELGVSLDIDDLVVIVAVPHVAYEGAISALLAAGAKKIAMEKPAAISLVSYDRMENLIQSAGAEVVVMTKRRCFPSYLKLRDTVRAGSNQIASIQISICRTFQSSAAGWRLIAGEAGSSVLFDLGYHALDLLTWLLPGEVGPVREGMRLKTRPVTQLRADIWFEGSPGRPAVSLFVDRQAPSPFEQIVVRFEDGLVVATPASFSDSRCLDLSRKDFCDLGARLTYSELMIHALYDGESTALEPFRYSAHRQTVRLAELAGAL